MNTFLSAYIYYRIAEFKASRTVIELEKHCFRQLEIGFRNSLLTFIMPRFYLSLKNCLSLFLLQIKFSSDFHKKCLQFFYLLIFVFNNLFILDLNYNIIQSEPATRILNRIMPPKKSISVQKQTKIFSSQTIQVKGGKGKQFSGKPSENLKVRTSVDKWKYGSGATPDKLFISSWNVNGIRSVLNKEDLQKYLKKASPDIICFNETKIDQETYEKSKDMFKFEGYHQYWNFCKVSSGYSGVAIFSKYLPIKCIEDIPNHAHHSQEGRVIALEFEKFFLISSYIPNAGQKLDRLDYRVKDWDVAFQDYLETLRKSKTVIWCGDINVCHKQIDIARPKGNQRTAGFTIEERNSFTSFLEKGWIDTYRNKYPNQVKYSWWSLRSGGRAKNIGWRLDYFVINKEGFKWVKDSVINNEVFGSDHCPIELHLDMK